MKFAEGDLVLARTPSSDEFERATVVGVRGSKYRVQFEGGSSEHTLAESDVKSRRTSRSQTRTKTRGGTKSPARSPGRRSPGRKSPARAANAQAGRKLALRQPRQAKISIARLEIPKDNSSDTDRTEGSESLKDEFVEPSGGGGGGGSRLKELGPVTRRSIRIMSNVSKAEHEQKLAALRGAERAVSLPAGRSYEGSPEAKGRGLSVQPADDVLKPAEADPADKHRRLELIAEPREWAGWPGALLLILLSPAYALLLQLVCGFGSCSEANVLALPGLGWRTLLDLPAFLAYAGFLGLVALASALPVGRLVDGQQSKTGSLPYRMNGVWTCLLAVAALFGLERLGYGACAFLVGKLTALTVAGLVYGVTLAAALYGKASRLPVSQLNMYASTSNAIYNFWQGKEVNPRVGPVDIKLVLCRSALIGTIIVNLAAATRLVQAKDHWSSVDFAPMAVAFLQSAYALDSLIFEASFVTSFEVLYEGTGYMLSLGYLIYPFLTSLNIRYLSSHKAQLHIYLQYFFFVSFFVGYLVYRLSNREKDKFRKNPFDPSVSKLESIPTRRGTRLLVSGWWGHVRHPNYLGDIIMHWSVALLSFSTTSVLPYVLAVQTTLLLIHRSIRDNSRCEDRYGYAWEQYCSRVKYRIIRGIF